MTPLQKRAAEQLISLFENGTTQIQYAYAERLADGRGITSGRAGFTTATGDAYEVVKLFTAKIPDNPLAVYLPRLKELAEKESASVKGLKGYSAVWAQTAQTAAFCRVQDQINDRLYYRPSVKYANEIGLKTALALAFVYDTIIQHGDGDDPDGLAALLNGARAKTGGTPADGYDEEMWLTAFIKVRRACLAHAHNPATRKEWAESVERCDVVARIAKTGNYALQTPFAVTWDGDKFTIRQQIASDKLPKVLNASF